VIELDLWFPPPLPELQADVQQRWARSKYRKAWHARVKAAVFTARPMSFPTYGTRSELYDALNYPLLPPGSEIALDYTRFSSGRRPDYINVCHSAKAIVDGLIGILIEDDNDDVIPLQTYRHLKCKRADQGVSLKIRQLR
jgi:hypothetical protein